jgi:uncharacterized membrane protein YphA (DoxX/SURF4 family)
MKILRNAARILLGITFVFSGFVKGVDPLGTTYKIIDYFTAFGTGWANSLAFSLSVLQALAEFGVGVALIVNYRMKISSWLALIFMAFFTPLTLWIAIENPVTDCGCFGDAIMLSNWETFYKNIILSILSIFVFVQRYNYRNRYNKSFQNGYFAAIMLVFIAIQFYSYNHLPVIDFRPYKVGNNIQEGMKIPENAPVDIYKTEFIYKNKNTGKEKKFNEENYPWQDTTNWEYVSSESILVEEGYHPPIHDFTIENSYGEDVKDFYLYDPNYTFMLISCNLEKAKTRKQKRIKEFAQKALDKGMNFICLTASTPEQIEVFKEEHNPPYEFFFCDEITLKTMIRSNPGLILTHEGTILDKWHWKDIPKFEKVEKK